LRASTSALPTVVSKTKEEIWKNNGSMASWKKKDNNQTNISVVYNKAYSALRKKELKKNKKKNQTNIYNSLSMKTNTLKYDEMLL